MNLILFNDLLLDIKISNIMKKINIYMDILYLKIHITHLFEMTDLIIFDGKNFANVNLFFQ